MKETRVTSATACNSVATYGTVTSPVALVVAALTMVMGAGLNLERLEFLKSTVNHAALDHNKEMPTSPWYADPESVRFIRAICISEQKKSCRGEVT